MTLPVEMSRARLLAVLALQAACIVAVGCSSPSARSAAVRGSVRRGGSAGLRGAAPVDPGGGLASPAVGDIACAICQRRFLTAADLKKHMERDHILCPHCAARGEDLWLTDKWEFQAHYDEAHRGVPAILPVGMGVAVVGVGALYSLAMYVITLL